MDAKGRRPIKPSFSSTSRRSSRINMPPHPKSRKARHRATLPHCRSGAVFGKRVDDSIFDITVERFNFSPRRAMRCAPISLAAARINGSQNLAALGRSGD